MKITDLLQSLMDGQVQYVLVGGLAVQLHGYMRSTFDIDLVLAMNDDNLTRFIDVAKRHGLTPGIPMPIESLRDGEQIERWHREKGMLAFSAARTAGRWRCGRCDRAAGSFLRKTDSQRGCRRSVRQACADRIHR
jgi:hypothetical protein